ncbi:hypothetical protein ACFLYD_01750 [Chloroflexota bacterium]
MTLALVLLLADLAWGSLWDLAVGADWHRLRPGHGSPTQPASPAVLPYTQPDSPGGRVFGRISRLGCWWRETFWPAVGPALLGLVAAAGLAAVLALLLPDRVRLLNAALVVLIVVGMAQRWLGRAPLVGQAFALVGLSWLAGYAAFAGVDWPSWGLALAFSLSTWGGLRVMQGQRGGLWLLNGGQAIAVALLAVLKEPLAAGVMGLLVFGQIALQLSLPHGGEPTRIMRRTWPWLMAAMLVAALAFP